MIADAALSSEALLEDEELSPAVLAGIHRELTRLLMSHGRLVVANDEAYERLRNSIRALFSRSPDAGKVWEEVLAARCVVAAPEIAVGLEDIITLDELRANWSAQVDAAFIEEVRALEIGIPCEGKTHELDPESGIEVAHWFAGWQTDVFGRLRELADHTTVPVGTARDDLARERLVPLIARAERIHILDRFLGVNLHECGPAHASRLAAKTETEWLLDIIGAHASGAIVSVYTTFDIGPDCRATAADVQSAFATLVGSRSLPGISRLQLFLAPPKRRLACGVVRFPHDRHLRFDDFGIGLSSGMDRLREPITTERFKLEYYWLADAIRELRADEDVARTLSGPPTRLIG